MSGMSSVIAVKALRVRYGDYDAVVIVTDHSDVDYRRLLAEAKIVVDTRDALRNVEGDKSKVFGL